MVVYGKHQYLKCYFYLDRINIPENLNVSSITYDPNNTNVFYVGTGESYVFGDVSGDGVWKSTNGGLTWSKVLGKLLQGQLFFSIFFKFNY